jgi:uncharacterized membrane protein
MDEGRIAELAQEMLNLDKGALTKREKAVIEHAAKRLAVSRNIGLEFERGATLGQRLADRVTEIGGSWGFIAVFGALVVGWMILNSVILAGHAFDAYPYILLNLALSMVAAIQAPIILMSQNRAAARDRLVAGHDYEVNLKAEIEIAALHDKLDRIRSHELAILIGRFEDGPPGTAPRAS